MSSATNSNNFTFVLLVAKCRMVFDTVISEFRNLTGWTPVRNNERIEGDLENSPLEIKTDSSLGSHEKVSVGFYTSEELWLGRVAIYFTSPPQYQLWNCINLMTNFPTDLPRDTMKVWKITLTITSGIRSLVIHCNNKELLKILMTDTTCTNKYWYRHWGKDVGMIEFSGDTASDYYRGNLGK